jgi:hypothetical protein
MRGYDREAVDRFLAALAGEAAAADLRMLPAPPDRLRDQSLFSAPARQHARERQTEWSRVADLPGVRLRRTNSLTDSKITGCSGEVLLTRRGRTMTLADGQMLRLDNQRPPRQQVADSGTGDPVLWIGRCHSYRSADGYILLPGQRYLTFPVRGNRSGNAVMTAVTESGITMLWFRRIGWRREYEIVVSPDGELAPAFLCVIMLAADWLSVYFTVPRGG